MEAVGDSEMTGTTHGQANQGREDTEARTSPGQGGTGRDSPQGLEADFSLSAQEAILDLLLRVVPRATRVGLKHGHKLSGENGPGEIAAQRGRPCSGVCVPETEAHQQRGEDGQDAGTEQRRNRGDNKDR